MWKCTHQHARVSLQSKHLIAPLPLCRGGSYNGLARQLMAMFTTPVARSVGNRASWQLAALCGDVRTYLRRAKRLGMAVRDAKVTVKLPHVHSDQNAMNSHRAGQVHLSPNWATYRSYLPPAVGVGVSLTWIAPPHTAETGRRFPGIG